MPLSHLIDTDNSIVQLELSGSIRIEEIERTVDELLSDPAFGPGFHILSDHSRLNDTATTETVKAIVPLLERIAERLGAFKCAVVVPRDASFGMARMANALADRIPTTILPFETRAEAEAWLREDCPTGG